MFKSVISNFDLIKFVWCTKIDVNIVFYVGISAAHIMIPKWLLVMCLVEY